MLRMNRSKTNIPKSKCANYNTDGKCLGIMIDKKLNQWRDVNKSGKRCLVIKGEECDYYNICVKPIVS